MPPHFALPLRAAVAAAADAALGAHALDNGMARTPPLGWNSWTACGTGVSESDLKSTADFFVSSGLKAAGYRYVNSDE